LEVVNVTRVLLLKDWEIQEFNIALLVARWRQIDLSDDSKVFDNE
jgi:hypothetical protein